MAKNRRPTRRPRDRGKTAGGREYLVQDRAAFASVLKDAIVRRHDGIVNRAVCEREIPYNTLKRYVEGTAGTIRHDTLMRFRDLVGDGEAQRLFGALKSPIAKSRERDYDDWLEYQYEMLVGPCSYEVTDMRRHTQRADRLLALRRLRRDLESRFPSYFKPLHEMLRGHFGRRATLALERIVAPLLDHQMSGGVERSWVEMDDDELRRFIAAGITRETILLCRESDVRRTQRETFERVQPPGSQPQKGRAQNARARLPIHARLADETLIGWFDADDDD